ncbi:hypothetical protein TELCIR_17068, partial [Teladorsagia circumcincta]
SSEPRNWAFGSSTPRDLAHMTAISSAQRVYDAKSPKKSVTSPEFATPVHKRSTTAPQPIQRPTAPTPSKRVDDDAASEPDFVQDRVEFIADIRKRNQNQKIANHNQKIQDQNQNNKASPVKSPQKVNLPLKCTVLNEYRKNCMKRKVPEHIVVSELNEALPAKEIVIDKDGAEDIGKLVEQKSNEILKKVENVSAEVAKDLKGFAKDLKATAEAKVTPKAEAISETVSAGLEKALGDVDEVLKKTEEVTTGTTDFISRIGSAITGAVTEAAVTTPSPSKESAAHSPALGSPIEPPHQKIVVGEATATKT